MSSCQQSQSKIRNHHHHHQRKKGKQQRYKPNKKKKLEQTTFFFRLACASSIISSSSFIIIFCHQCRRRSNSSQTKQVVLIDSSSFDRPHAMIMKGMTMTATTTTTTTTSATTRRSSRYCCCSNSRNSNSSRGVLPVLVVVLGMLSSMMIPTTTALRSFVSPSDLKQIPLTNGAITLEDTTRNPWMSLDKETEFLPIAKNAHQYQTAARRQLGNSNNGNNGGTSDTNPMYSVSPYSSQAFVEGDVEYDEYQQAWRYLGFMIDCDDVGDDDEDDHNSNEEGTTGEGCARYVVWAAYVDLEYEGGGISEYMYWNTTYKKWDDSACSGDGNDRCVKMDCHLSNTHFSLLGVFKHRSYDDWMEQLFKHEGYCVWTDDEYSFMSNARKAWPGGCTSSGYTAVVSNGNTQDDEDDGGTSSSTTSIPIYYDLKPTANGGMTVGLYTDTRCVREYQSYGNDDPTTIENVIGNMFENGGSGDHNDENGGDYNYGDSFDEALSMWDSAFDKWKVCQPCVAYDLYGYHQGNDDDDNNNGRNLEGENNGDYSCYDDADYTNVNQCMKFMAKTNMNAATYRDLSLAMQQGSMRDFELSALASHNQSTWAVVSQRAGMKSFLTILFLLFSIFIFCGGLHFLHQARKAYHKSSTNVKSLKEPLVFA